MKFFWFKICISTHITSGGLRWYVYFVFWYSSIGLFVGEGRGNLVLLIEKNHTYEYSYTTGIWVFIPMWHEARLIKVYVRMYRRSMSIC